MHLYVWLCMYLRQHAFNIITQHVLLLIIMNHHYNHSELWTLFDIMKHHLVGGFTPMKHIRRSSNHSLSTRENKRMSIKAPTSKSWILVNHHHSTIITSTMNSILDPFQAFPLFGEQQRFHRSLLVQLQRPGPLTRLFLGAEPGGQVSG